jgi:hypothetical protein
MKKEKTGSAVPLKTYPHRRHDTTGEVSGAPWHFSQTTSQSTGPALWARPGAVVQASATVGYNCTPATHACELLR